MLLLCRSKYGEICWHLRHEDMVGLALRAFFVKELIYRVITGFVLRRQSMTRNKAFEVSEVHIWMLGCFLH